MTNRDFSEIVSLVRPPEPEVPRAEQLAMERQQVFHSHQPGMAPRGPENPEREFQSTVQDVPPTGMAPGAACVLDERGGHLRLGSNCPHFRNFDRDEVITVTW